MTAPDEQRLDDSNQPPPAPPDEDSALIPAALAAYAAYRTWRGAHNGLPSGWQQVALALNLRRLVGGQLAMVATRALRRQQQTSGRSGDDLWNFTDAGIQTGVEAGVRTLASGLIHTDTKADGVPKTKDAATPGEAAIPTASNPPNLLAQMTAQAVMNAAVFAASSAAGWTKKTWHSVEDDRVRPTHRTLDRTTVPMDKPFVSPSGAKLRFPGDPRAPIAEVANCRCWIEMARR